jgi:glucose/arabinose dehydrogenase
MALGAHDTVFVGSMRDGSLLVSDDDNDVIYRITYTGPAQ